MFPSGHPFSMGDQALTYQLSSPSFLLHRHPFCFFFSNSYRFRYVTYLDTFPHRGKLTFTCSFALHCFALFMTHQRESRLFLSKETICPNCSPSRNLKKIGQLTNTIRRIGLSNRMGVCLRFLISILL